MKLIIIYIHSKQMDKKCNFNYNQEIQIHQNLIKMNTIQKINLNNYIKLKKFLIKRINYLVMILIIFWNLKNKNNN